MAIDRNTLERINLELVEGNNASIKEFRKSVTALLSENTVVHDHFQQWKRSGYDPDVLVTGVKQQLIDRSKRGVVPPASNLSDPDNLARFQAALRDKAYEEQAEIIASTLRYAAWCDTFRALAAKYTTT